MFSDTLTITINGNAKVLTRINQDGYSSEYLARSPLDELKLKIRNTSYVDKARAGRKIDRHTVELVQTVFPTGSAISNTIRKAYTVLENEASDGTVEPLNFDLGFMGFFTSPNVTKLLNWES